MRTMEPIVKNKKAYFDYLILETYEAGIILSGSEIKSIRGKKININDAYVTFRNGEIFLLNAHIDKYVFSNIFNHEERRTRKLLLNKREIAKLSSKVKEGGLTVIPLTVFLKHGLAKIEIALVKGKKNYDKRETLKNREENLRLKKAIKNYDSK